MTKKAFTVFVEYQVKPEKWDVYTDIIGELKQLMKSEVPECEHQFLLSTQQPYRVVEVITLPHSTKISLIRELCIHQYPLSSLLQRPQKQINIWSFSNLEVDDEI